MSAIPARLLPLGNLLVFSPLGLSFVDDFTQDSPIGFLNPKLEVETAPGSNTWQPTGVRGLFTPSGLLAYPNLGRRGRAPTPPTTTNYRVTVVAQYYDPLYSQATYNSGVARPDGIVFSVTPYDDGTDFKALNLTPTRVTLPLLARANYPFAGKVALLRGNVRRAGAAVVALVTAVEPFDDTGDTKQTRVLTDPGGVFRLPLRWGNKGTPAQPTPTTVTATDPVSGRSGSLKLTYPYVLTNPQTITIPNP
jgi:hypothetical protein